MLEQAGQRDRMECGDPGGVGQGDALGVVPAMSTAAAFCDGSAASVRMLDRAQVEGPDAGEVVGVDGVER